MNKNSEREVEKAYRLLKNNHSDMDIFDLLTGRKYVGMIGELCPKGKVFVYF